MLKDLFCNIQMIEMHVSCIIYINEFHFVCLNPSASISFETLAAEMIKFR